MKRDIKLRFQESDLHESKVRLRLPGRLAGELDAYAALYARVHGHEIELPVLIEGILEQFLASDRAFQRSRKSSAARPASGSQLTLEGDRT